MQRLSLVMSLALLVAAADRRADAAIVVGGSTLLDQTFADQLQDWLGEGPIQLTNIYTKQDGHTAADFHAAVDGQGRTFAVLEVLANAATDITTNITDNRRQIIGGFNPQSWSSDGGFNFTPDDADRTAFIFNLTTMEIQRQSLASEPSNGEYQTRNDLGLGPVFGGGADIVVEGNLSNGGALNYSYGGTAFVNNILEGSSYYHYGANVFGAIEIFTIAAAPVDGDGDVPEPGQLVVWSSLMGIGLGLVRYEKRRARQTR